MTDFNVGTEKAKSKNQHKQESESMLSLGEGYAVCKEWKHKREVL